MPVYLNSYLITCAQEWPIYKAAAYRVNRKSQAAQHWTTDDLWRMLHACSHSVQPVFLASKKNGYDARKNAALIYAHNAQNNDQI